MAQSANPELLTGQTSGATREAARTYTQCGLSVIPIPYQQKSPGFRNWQQLRLTADDIDQYFNEGQQNIGVLLGEPSGWLIDIDLDHPRARELAPQYLLPTPAIFGRVSNPCSHWLYRVTTPLATKKFPSKSAGMLVEIRSTGMQTVFPPSVHESGESIDWISHDRTPALVESEELLKAVEALASAVKVELGEKAAPKPRGAARSTKDSKPATSTLPADERSARCYRAMLRISIADSNDGSRRLYAAACRTIEHDLDEQTALDLIQRYAVDRPFSKQWTDEDILQRIRDAERQCRRGAALEIDGEGFPSVGARDSQTGKLILNPKQTLPTAQLYVNEFHSHPEGRTLHHHAGQLLQWRGNRYVEVEDAEVRHTLQPWLHDALRYTVNRNTQEPELVPFDSNPGSVNAALQSIKDHTYLSHEIGSPAWLKQPPIDIDPRDLLTGRTQLLHLPTMRQYPGSPLFFTTSALTFDPDPEAPEPMHWHRFMHQLFDGDIQSLDLLQEWFGYCLTGDTRQQKMMLIVGPKRGGKGTIARVLKELIGTTNVCGPTTSSLGGTFGLQPLIGKSLAIVSDARFHGDNITAVVERLLCISGEDALTIDRKHLTALTMKLPTRFMFLTNEFPRLSDASGALAGRFIILRLTESFYGKEDLHLTDKLLRELPGILNWAIEGWKRLRERGHFVMPESVADAVQEIEDLSSPVKAFVRETCDVGPALRVDVKDLYQAYRRWCEDGGRTMVPTTQGFGRDLMAAIPGISRRRGTANVTFYDGIAITFQGGDL